MQILRHRRRPMIVVPKWIAVFMLILFIMGCAPASLRQGRSYLAKEKYPQALEALTRALNEDPDNPEIHRELGITYYKTKQYEQALEELKTAKQGLEKDDRVIFYTGLTYEKLKLYDEAIEEYGNYTKLGRFSRVRGKIQQRLQWLAQRQASKWAQERMEIEKEIDPASIPDNSVGVTYFKPIGVSEELEPLHKGLTDLLIVDLSMVDELTVVERIKLNQIYDELGFSSTDLVEQDTAPRMGKLLGASSLVTGAFTGFGDDQWRVDPTLGLVKLGRFEALDSVEGQIERFIQIEKQLVMDVLEGLGIELTQEQRDEIMENIPTESLKAFLAYSRGLDYSDRGMYSEALQEFEAAVSLDPKFNRAKEHQAGARFMSQPTETTDELEMAWDSAFSSEALKTEFLATTVQSVSRGDVDPTSGSDLELTEEETEVQLDVLIQW